MFFSSPFGSMVQYSVVSYRKNLYAVSSRDVAEQIEEDCLWNG